MPPSLRAAPPPPPNRGRYKAQYTAKPPALPRAAKLKTNPSYLENKDDISETFEEIYLGPRPSSRRSVGRQLDGQEASWQPGSVGDGGNTLEKGLHRGREVVRECVSSVEGSAKWWKEEYWWGVLCLVGMGGLVVLLRSCEICFCQ